MRGGESWQMRYVTGPIIVGLFASFFWWLTGVMSFDRWMRVAIVTLYCGDALRKFVFWPDFARTGER